jgi:hypothetical protein
MSTALPTPTEQLVYVSASTHLISSMRNTVMFRSLANSLSLVGYPKTHNEAKSNSSDSSGTAATLERKTL